MSNHTITQTGEEDTTLLRPPVLSPEELPTIFSQPAETEDRPTVLSRPGQKPAPASRPQNRQAVLQYRGSNQLLPKQFTIHVPLGATPYVMGRADPLKKGDAPDYEFTAALRNISRKHAALLLHNGQVAVSDLRSVNGTFINGVRLEPNQYYYLKTGDILSFTSKKIDFQVTVN